MTTNLKATIWAVTVSKRHEATGKGEQVAESTASAEVMQEWHRLKAESFPASHEVRLIKNGQVVNHT